MWYRHWGQLRQADAIGILAEHGSMSLAAANYLPSLIVPLELVAADAAGRRAATTAYRYGAV